MAKKRKVPETFEGQRLSIPRIVKRSDAYRGCSPLARALLIELADQHNGANNGHLHLSYAYLSKQGFKSKDQIAKGRDELIQRNLIVLTRQGGLPTRKSGQMTFEGASLYAVTWLPISNYVGLQTTSGQSHLGAWMGTVSMPERKQPASLTKKHEMQPAPRDRNDPLHGSEMRRSDPLHGSVGGGFCGLSGPPHGHNVIRHTSAEITTAKRQAGMLAEGVMKTTQGRDPDRHLCEAHTMTVDEQAWSRYVRLN